MSEEEIYNYLIYFVSRKIKQKKLDLQDMVGFNLGYLSTEELQKAVQGLLDLYTHKKGRVEELKQELLEEKEKNKELENKIKEYEKIFNRQKELEQEKNNLMKQGWL